MNPCTAPVFTALMAATFAGKSTLSRCIAGAAGFTTVFGSQKFVEDIGSKIANSLEENNYLSFAEDTNTEDLKKIVKSICQIAINTFSLFSCMWIASTILPVASFSLPGAFLISSLTTIGTEKLKYKLLLKQEAPPLFFIILE